MSSGHCSVGQQAADPLPSVPASVADLLQQVTLRPRWFTAIVPLAQDSHGFVVGKIKPTYNATADTERSKVTVRPSDSGRYRGKELTRAIHAVRLPRSYCAVASRWTRCPRGFNRLREILRYKDCFRPQVLDEHRPRPRVFVIQEAREARHLCARRGRRVGLKLSGEALLELFHTATDKTTRAPEHMEAFRRRMQHVGRRRQIGTRRQARQEARSIGVNLEEYMPNRCDRLAGP
ncbi:MAG TPA: hypothetical protein VG963_00850 [Polyangiaceae bacterium]|nr:hypothetical protein [Polyangiaceae bacterium]